jgi:hypothetical protein
MKNRLFIATIVTLLVLNLTLLFLIRVPLYATTCAVQGECFWDDCYNDVMADCQQECYWYNSTCNGCEAMWDNCGFRDCLCWSNWDCECENQESFYVLCSEYDPESCSEEQK